jgi:hypothetical protein
MPDPCRYQVTDTSHGGGVPLIDALADILAATDNLTARHLAGELRSFRERDARHYAENPPGAAPPRQRELAAAAAARAQAAVLVVVEREWDELAWAPVQELALNCANLRHLLRTLDVGPGAAAAAKARMITLADVVELLAGALALRDRAEAAGPEALRNELQRALEPLRSAVAYAAGDVAASAREWSRHLGTPPRRVAGEEWPGGPS